MKRITISIDSNLDMKFRKKASQKYQFEKGWYSNAVAEAMAYWAEEDSEEVKTNKPETFTLLKDYINPELLNKVNTELNLNDEKFESLINHINHDTPYKLIITREHNKMVIKIENNESNNIKRNLESYLFLHQSLEIILSALEETSKEKFEIVGIGELPPVYIKKIKE